MGVGIKVQGKESCRLGNFEHCLPASHTQDYWDSVVVASLLELPVLVPQPEGYNTVYSKVFGCNISLGTLLLRSFTL
jgi:hypothetical protein